MVIEKIIIKNKKNLEKLKQNFRKEGNLKIHILADFDRTLTCATINGKPVSSIMHFLRSGNYVSDKYAQKSNQLADKYHPIEVNPNIPLEEKKEKMKEWWMKHFDLLIKSGLNKKHLQIMVDLAEKTGALRFREGSLEFISLLHEKNIPLVIISSSGLGEVIPMLLKNHGKLYSNIYVVSNSFKWDENGKAIDYKKPIIHVFNKDETILKKIPKIYKQVKNRKNVILLGDSLGDLGMITGFDYDKLIKVGVLNENVDKNLEVYKKNFDVIITNDGNLNYVNKLMKEILE